MSDKGEAEEKVLKLMDKIDESLGRLGLEPLDPAAPRAPHAPPAPSEDGLPSFRALLESILKSAYQWHTVIRNTHTARAAPPSAAEAPTLDLERLHRRLEVITNAALRFQDRARRDHLRGMDLSDAIIILGESAEAAKAIFEEKGRRVQQARNASLVRAVPEVDSNRGVVGPSAAEAQEPGIPAVEAVQSLGCNSSHAEAQESPRLIELARGMALGRHTSGKPGHDLAFASCRHPDCTIVREAQAARPAPPLDWHPIATVPQDRRWVLVWQEDAEFSIYRFGPDLISEPDDVQWTHWAPIAPPDARRPAPVTTEESEG